MGNSSSKSAVPEPSHVWEAKTPVRFSQTLVDHLESSAESDSTRSKSVELHIQARVAEELKRLQEREAQTLEALSAHLSTAASSASDADESSMAASKTSLGRESVQTEIDSLRRKLESRKKVKDIWELDAEVEPARERLIQCLRTHDRRPLNCSEEVSAFKEVVGRVEGRWVEKVLR